MTQPPPNHEEPQPPAPAHPGGSGWRRLIRIATFLMAAVVLVLAVQLIVPHLSRRYDQPTRIYCASNMKQIGLGAIMYANNNYGRFPDDLATLIETQDLEPRVLMCPMTAPDVPVAPTTRAVVADHGQLTNQCNLAS